MSRPFLSEPKSHISIAGLSRYQADTFYINNEEHMTFTDNIDMNNHKIMNLSDGVTNNDAVNKKQLDALSTLINQPNTIKVVKRVKTGRFQNSIRSQILFNDTFYFGYVVDCYLEVFTGNLINSKYIINYHLS